MFGDVFTAVVVVVAKSSLIGSLRKDVGDVNENGIKAIGLDWQKFNFARASRFLVHFLAVVARLRRETS